MRAKLSFAAFLLLLLKVMAISPENQRANVPLATISRTARATKQNGRIFGLWEKIRPASYFGFWGTSGIGGWPSFTNPTAVHNHFHFGPNGNNGNNGNGNGNHGNGNHGNGNHGNHGNGNHGNHGNGNNGNGNNGYWNGNGYGSGYCPRCSTGKNAAVKQAKASTTKNSGQKAKSNLAPKRGGSWFIF